MPATRRVPRSAAQPIGSGRRLPPALWGWLLTAPVSVVATLVLLHNLLAVFAVYHVGLCLIVPLAVNLLQRRSLGGHLRDLGLSGPGTRGGLLWGLGLALVCGGGILGTFRLLGDVLLQDNSVAAVLTDWGAGPQRRALVFWFMALLNGPAEEVYWRGFLQSRLAAVAGPGRRLWLPSLCYASYHGMTVFLFLSSTAVAALFMVCILAAGWVWAWLRARTGSAWPGVLSHAAASAAYMLVARPLLWP